MNFPTIKNRVLLWILFALATAIGGCATSLESIDLVVTSRDFEHLQSYADPIVEVKGKGGVTLDPEVRNRVKQLILNAVQLDCMKRLRSPEDVNRGKHIIYALVLVKRYQEGNPFVNSEVAQIQMDADVRLSHENTKKILALYEVKRSYNGKGMHLFTSIRDIEEDFAKLVAAAILGVKSVNNPATVCDS